LIVTALDHRGACVCSEHFAIFEIVDREDARQTTAAAADGDNFHDRDMFTARHDVLRLGLLVVLLADTSSSVAFWRTGF
jgi:hypothetical protein